MRHLEDERLAVREIERFERLAHLRERLSEIERSRSTSPIAEVHSAPLDVDRLSDLLSLTVVDQERAVAQIASALAGPLNGLKVRPQRPNGVFLFNGPTGVGKTSMARALADVVYGSVEQLHVVDCSEFASSAAINGIIGPPPGLVGHDRPAGWLTTRVIARPRSVVLFDEIEKAGSELWNLLLQVCDAGRLTDTRGNVADFSHTIVVMTGNMGAVEASRPSIGFAPSSAGRSNVQSAAVERVLPPELLSRMDDVITFEPLDRASLRRIARNRAQEFAASVAANGWHLEIDDDVLDAVVASASRVQLGARQIERLLERQVLSGLAGYRPGCFRASVVDGEVAWSRTQG